jgi:hypothetical protein
MGGPLLGKRPAPSAITILGRAKWQIDIFLAQGKKIPSSETSTVACSTVNKTNLTSVRGDYLACFEPSNQQIYCTLAKSIRQRGIDAYPFRRSWEHVYAELGKTAHQRNRFGPFLDDDFLAQGQANHDWLRKHVSVSMSLVLPSSSALIVRVIGTLFQGWLSLEGSQASIFDTAAEHVAKRRCLAALPLKDPPGISMK